MTSATDRATTAQDDGRLYFEELSVGASWTTPARTVTETDVVNFAGMTGDYDALHVDHEYARQTPFGRPIAHGLLGLSLVAGLGSQCPAVKTVAFVAIREWEFVRPIFIGDTVHAETEVVEVRPSGRRCGHVTWRRQLINQEGKAVQSGLFETLVAKAEFARRQSRRDAAEKSPPAPHQRPSVAPSSSSLRRQA